MRPFCKQIAIFELNRQNFERFNCRLLFWLWKQLTLLICGNIFIINRLIRDMLTMKTCPACARVVSFARCPRIGGAGIIPWYSRINSCGPKNWFRALTLSFKCRQLHIVKDSQIHCIHTHNTNTCIYFEIIKRNCEETKYNKKLVGCSCSACRP